MKWCNKNFKKLKLGSSRSFSIRGGNHIPSAEKELKRIVMEYFESPKPRNIRKRPPFKYRMTLNEYKRNQIYKFKGTLRSGENLD